MITAIRVFSRQEIEYIKEKKISFPGNTPWALISIHSGKSFINTKSDFEELSTIGCVDYISLDFHDVTEEYYLRMKQKYKEGANRFKLFSKKQTHSIVNFINEINTNLIPTLLVVHCEAGISRSAAVALFACRYLGLDEELFRIRHPAINPNDYIYDTLYKVSGMRNNYVKFWYKLLNNISL